MRISDWSSDVCSSDLAEFFQAPVLHDDLDARVMNVVAATEAIEDPHDRGRIDQQVRFRHERFGELAEDRHASQAAADVEAVANFARLELGRASWRERECQYV